MRTAILLAVIAVVVLAALNPGMQKFEQFAAAQSEMIVQEEMEDRILGSVLGGAAGNLVEDYINRVTERKNYIIFSVYTVDLDGADAEAQEWRFLGLADNFFELERPEALEDEQ